MTTLRSLLQALALAMNLIDSEIEHHHEQTAYLAYQIGVEMGLEVEEQHLLVCASLLHDVGSVVIGRYHGLLDIESNRREVAALGARMIRDLEPFEEIASIIELSQNSYQENLRAMENGALESHVRIADLIHMADAVSAIWNKDEEILNQVPQIRDIIVSCREKEFCPESVDAFLRVSQREFIWMDFILNPSFLMLFTGDMHQLSLDYTLKLTRLMSRIIDYRSPFTAMHSAGVAASAKKLAELCGMDEEDCKKMEIAGNLHDVGKLRVPSSILEKPGKLTDEEFNVIKEHPYYTRLILKDVVGFEDIADWAGFHHEKLSGKGYPFHFNDAYLSLGSRIMAVADIFSAITEERPYRKPMSREQAMKIMWEDVERGDIDGEIVKRLEENYDEVNREREAKSKEAGKRYFESIKQ